MMDEKSMNTIELQGKLIMYQLKEDFNNEEDFEIHTISPTLPYRSDSIICTDLVIAKIIQTLKNNKNSMVYVLMMMLNIMFFNRDREKYRGNLLDKLGVSRKVYIFDNPFQFISKIKSEINKNQICYIEANKNELPYRFDYMSYKKSDENHEIIISGYNNNKKCLIGYDASVSYSLRLFDEFIDSSVFFRLYYSEDLISKIAKQDLNTYCIYSFGANEINDDCSRLNELIKDVLQVDLNSYLCNIIKKLLNGYEYSNELLKMISIGCFEIFFQVFEILFKSSLSDTFFQIKNSEITFRKKVFNKILKYKYTKNKKHLEECEMLEKLYNEVRIRDSKFKLFILNQISN